jgi:PAS domain S-box-containing protein
VLLDRDFRILDLNQCAESLGGRPRQDILGLTHWEAWPASLGTVLEQEYRRAMLKRAHVSFEHHYERDTRNAWTLIEAHPVSEGLAVFAHDITEQKRSEEQLRQSEARLQAAVDVVKPGRYAWNLQTDELEWDDTVRAMWGCLRARRSITMCGGPACIRTILRASSPRSSGAPNHGATACTTSSTG